MRGRKSLSRWHLQAQRTNRNFIQRKHVDWDKFRIYVVSNFVPGKFGEPKSAASKKPVVLHSLVMGLLKHWRETTAYAGDEDFIFASAGSKAKHRACRTCWSKTIFIPASPAAASCPNGGSSAAPGRP